MNQSTFVVLCVLSAALVPKQSAEPDTDLDGGVLAVDREATGFIRVDQVDYRRMFITREGSGYFALVANHNGTFLQGESADLLNRFNGNLEKAEEALTQTLRDLEQNAGELDAPFWPPLQGRLPWVADIDYPAGANKYRFDVFDPVFTSLAGVASFLNRRMGP